MKTIILFWVLFGLLIYVGVCKNEKSRTMSNLALSMVLWPVAMMFGIYYAFKEIKRKQQEREMIETFVFNYLDSKRKSSTEKDKDVEVL